VRTNDIFQNEHEQFLLFPLCHYHSYFINDIKLLNIVQTEIKQLNFICSFYGKILLHCQVKNAVNKFFNGEIYFDFVKIDLNFFIFENIFL